MSIPSEKPWAAEGGKAALPKLYLLPEWGMRLGHCRICNVLSLMWSAIGIQSFLYSYATDMPQLIRGFCLHL
jgi:hypothetical protein